MSQRKKILALVAVYNRAQKTTKCISKLVEMSNSLSNEIDMDICVVDDGSTDATVGLLREYFHNISIIGTGGQKFWAGSMRLGFERAWSETYDGLLVFNDDTVFFDHALEEVFSSAIDKDVFLANAKPTVVVGTLCYTNALSNISYGGQVKRHNFFRPSFVRLTPNGKIQQCDTLNMNFALINAPCIKKNGFLSPSFQHSLADFDYGLSVSRSGGSVLVCPSVVGSCDRNTIKSTWRDTNLGFLKRYSLLRSPKGMPLKERFIFVTRNFVWSNYISLLIPYLLLLKDEFYRLRNK